MGYPVGSGVQNPCFFLHAILIDLSRFSRASLTPLGGMFKIHNIFLRDFIGFLTSINYMDKWVTPLGVR